MNGWKAEKAKERQGAVTGVAPGKSFPRDFPTIRYHESTISTKLASHNMRWWAVGQCQGGSPTFSFLCSFSFIAEPFTQTLAWAKPEPRFGKTRRWLRQLGLPSYSLRQVHFQAADMFWPQARKSHAFSISHFVAFDLFQPFCQALSHRTTTPSWKFSISHRCSGMPSPCNNALTFWNHLQSLFATATKIKCHRQEVGACSTILLSWFDPMVMGCLHQSKCWWRHAARQLAKFQHSPP